MNFLNKFKSFQKKNADRCRSFYSSTISGLFTGIIIGIFFSLTTDSQFNRWINLSSFELVAAIIYLLFIYVISFILYFVGKGCMYFFISKKKKDLVNFKINFFAGMYSASWSSFLVMNHNKIITAVIVSAVFIILYIPTVYLTLKQQK